MTWGGVCGEGGGALCLLKTVEGGEEEAECFAAAEKCEANAVVLLGAWVERPAGLCNDDDVAAAEGDRPSLWREGGGGSG